MNLRICGNALKKSQLQTETWTYAILYTMANSQDDSDWDKSTSEIQSEDSGELFESRPNRWRGPPQSWRTLNEEDRLAFGALERLRNQDLSVHLYSTFALKQPPTVPGLQILGADVQAQGNEAEPWVPPKSWSAWPLRADLVPPDDLMKSTEDEDEALTLRKIQSKAPSSQLEEVVNAAILRSAKEKFHKRQVYGPLAGTHDHNVVKSDPSSSENNPIANNEESEGEKVEMRSENTQTARKKASQKTYKPTVATDDDASYELIRPSTRDILSKLDRTLTVLHNARNTSYGGLTDSDSSSSDGEDDLYDEAAPGGHRSRSRAKSRSRQTSRATSVASNLGAGACSQFQEADASPSKSTANYGRKMVTLPREGESERDFLRRRAIEQKKKRPVFSDEETTTAGEGARSPRKSRKKRTRPRSDNGVFWLQKRVNRLDLRGWSDVMGAAALAGFDARVIERATQRCANLFGQGMDMHTINEDARMETKRYLPDQIVLSSGSEDEDEGRQTDDQHHSTSRHSSLAPSRPISLASSDGEEHDDERRGFSSPRKRQRRGSSRGSALDAYYCHHEGCERAIRSFDRPANLRRHLKLIHGEGDWQEGHTPQPERKEFYNCPHTGCERATRPFHKGHNLRRHLQLVHGEETGESSKDRSRSRSRVPAAQHICPHIDCDRAGRPFGRKTNLTRHLKLVHGEEEEEDGPGNQRQSRQQDGRKELTGKSTPRKALQKAASDDGDSDSGKFESSTSFESG